MDLVERYVNAIRTFLPKAQQDDIVKELAGNIRAEMDDREDELGRPLTEGEQEAILRQHGHPMLVAGRYQPNQGSVVFGRQLIGTALFPFYLRVLGIAMGISFAIYLIVLSALIVSGNPVTFGGTLNAIVLQVFFQFGAVTLIFAGVEQYLPSMHWDARSLPTPSPARKRNEVSRLGSIAQIVVLLVLLVWLRVLLETPSLLFGPAADTYRLGPVWQQALLPTLILYAVYLGQAVANLFRPDWTSLPRIVRVVTDLGGLGILIYLLQAGQWVVLVNPNSDANALSTINNWVYYSMLGVAVGFVVVTAMDAWKLIRGERKQEV